MAIRTPAKLDETALLGLESSLRGELLRPDHPSYEEQRRVWNGSISRRPALIARCTGVADVIAAVQFARRTGLELAVRSGGHSFSGLSVADDARVAHLGAMKGIRVDPEARSERAQGRVLLGGIDSEQQLVGIRLPP